MIDVLQFKDLFVSEAEDHVRKLNDNLLALEKDPKGRKLLDELMRSAHTVKGSSAIMGYNKLAFLMHVLEDVFDYARNDALEMTPEILQALFDALDFLEKSLTAIKKSGKESDVGPVAENLKKIAGVVTEGVVGKSFRTAAGKPIVERPKKKPRVEASIRDIEMIGKFQRAAKEAPGVEVAEKIDHVKVPVERLDRLLVLMEGILIDTMRLENFVKTSDAEHRIPDKSKARSQLSGTVEHLSRLVSDLRYHVMQARLVPVEQIFARFPRMVRDLAVEQKKKVAFEMTASELELDRTIIDTLVEPLVHLLRNAVDHGIGKSGTIRLTAQRERDHALISVEDDGRGIDWQLVVRAALKREIISTKKGKEYRSYLSSLRGQLTPGGSSQDTRGQMAEIEDLVYHPRLSTKETVSETSGRGVGLSAVKNFVEEMGGRVIVESPIPKEDKPGGRSSGSDAHRGTRFILELPLTLAIIDALLVLVRNSTFAIPFSSIERIVDISESDVKSMADQDVAVVDGTDVPLVRLDRVLNLREKHNPEPRLTAVLVRQGEDTAGLIVDQAMHKQEIIVRPLPPALRGIPGFSGSTILADARVVLILDVISLLHVPDVFVRTS